MFGSLFEEGGGDGLLSQHTELTPPAPDPRGRTKLAGIWNQGSTCFLNTALQSFALIPEIRGALFRLSPKELGHYETDSKKVRIIPYEIQRLIASLMLEQQRAISSKLVTDSFGWSNGVTQQDVQELCSVLLPALNDSLKGTSGQTLIRDLLHVKTVQKIECQGCGNITEKEAEESTLFVQVEGFPNGLKDSLFNSFCNAETMTGDNRYRCDKCEAHRDAKKMIKLRSLPPVLMLALNRFATDSNWKAYKVIDRFPFPMELDMSTYCEAGQSCEDAMYELTSVIVHSGSCGGGHYTACIRDVDCLGHWESLDEESIEKALKAQPGQAVMKDLVDCVSPKQVVATVLAKSIQTYGKVTVDKLSAEIGKQTGVPWARRYKRRCGSFPKFLKDNADTFCVNGNMVTLMETEDTGAGKERQDTSDQVEEPREGTNDSSSVEATSDVGSAIGRTSPKNEQRSVKKKQTPPPPPGYRWFFFNDASVSPMLAEDLKNEFGGRKSAYLLFYRRKNLERPTEAEGNPAYGIPAVLLEEMTKKNEELEKEREEYERKESERKAEEERKKQEVQIEIRYYWNHKIDNGVLTTGEKPFLVTRSRSEKLSDLLEFIAFLSCGKLEAGQFHVHRMRCWDDKTHLYDELSDKDKMLQELSIEDGTILFAWDGHQVGGVPVPTGLESEPLTLQLKQYSSPFSIYYNFPKNMTLREFRGQVSKLTGIEEDLLKLQLPDVVVATELDNSRELETLESVHLTDKSCVLFDGTNRTTFAAHVSSPHTESDTSDAEPMFTDSKFCVRIENRTNKDVNSSWPVLELEVERNMSVGDMKREYMKMYSIQCESAVLQEAHPVNGLQLPYDENLTVADAGITMDTKLVLDSSLMVLTFKLHPSEQPDDTSMQVTIKRNCTVEECLLAVTKVANLTEPYDWHLCKTNFLHERQNVLNDLTEVMDASFDGQFLLLERGQLLPKDHICIPMWLHPTPNQLCLLQDSVLKIDDILKLDTLPKDGKKDSINEPCFIGEIEMHKDATLEMLRCKVVELLAAHDHHASASQLRLRLMEGKCQRLRKVLRDPRNTLRRMKVDGKTPVGVQIVNQGADLLQEQILLNVQVRNLRDMTYERPGEMVWDTRCGTSASKLKQEIASRLFMKDDMMVVAKHFPQEFQWKILKDVIQAPPSRGSNAKRGRKRGPLPKSNVRHKPFYVDDGDVIGVIDLMSYVPTAVQSSSVSVDDFSTNEDALGRLLLEEQRHKKQLERQARGLVNGLSASVMRRPEIPLKIEVQEFS